MVGATADVKPAVRVVSVLPSATEMLCFIGGEALLVGRSHEDNFPKTVERLPLVTGPRASFGPQPDGSFTEAATVDAKVSAKIGRGESLYTLDAATIKALRPDLLLTQNLCSVCAIDAGTVDRMIATFDDPKPRVLSLDALSLRDVVVTSLERLGDAVGMASEAKEAAQGLRVRIDRVEAAVKEARRPCVAFLEWSDPLYVGGHWTPELIRMAGGSHPLNPASSEGAAPSSFAVEPSLVVASEPEVVIIAPCGLSLAEAKREARRICSSEWFQTLNEKTRKRVLIVDGDAMFNRPGPRLVDALEWIHAILAPLRDHSIENAPSGKEWLKLVDSKYTANFPAILFEEQDIIPPSVVASACDIEEAHRCAVERGDVKYTDPATGYSVYTQLASEQRGFCCGSGCRHCVYGHVNVKPPARKARLAPPILVVK